MENYKITNEMKVASYTLDLKDIQNQSNISLIVAKYNIEAPIRKGIVSSNPTWEMNLELEVEVSPQLKIRDKNNLLIITGVKQPGNKITIEQTASICPIEIQLNPEEIIDCDQPGAMGKYPIKYTLKSQYIDYTGLLRKKRLECEWHSQEGEMLQIEFKPILAEPICSVETKGCAPVYNIVEEKILVGHLKLQHSQTKFASAPLFGKFDLGLINKDDSFYNDLLTLDIDDIKDENPYIERANGANMQDRSGEIRNSAFAIRCENGVYVYEGLYPNEVVTIPIYLNLRGTNLRNPVEDCDIYKISVNPQKYDSCQYVKNGGKVVKKPESRCIIKNNKFEFKLRKDESILEAALFLVTTKAGREAAMLWSLENGCENEYHAASMATNKIIVNGVIGSNYKLRIKNLAGSQDGNSGILVRNFQVNQICCNDAGIKLLDNESNHIRLLGDVFTVIPCKPTEHLRATEFCDITVIFNPQIVSKMINREGRDCVSTKAELDFQYSYYELGADEDVDAIRDDQYSVVRGTLTIPLEMKPNPEWFCLDYGTSAVVAAYGILEEETVAEDILYDLRAAKARLLMRSVKDVNKRRTNDEVGTKFISSQIALNKTPIGQWDEIRAEAKYAESYVWFSPADAMIDYNYVYPCLKSLMGYDRVPDTLFPNKNEILRGTGLDRVDNLYPIVYKQMFEYYRPVRQIQNTTVAVDKGEIHQLVMSVPNTFAPVHLEQLATIAREVFPNLRDDKLLFLSESDAIAYKYINRREEIIGLNQLPESVADVFDKRVLVYDMGAGTLDLTYFVKSQEIENVGAPLARAITVDIRGKMGISKSGNYVDYLIAEIIADLMRGSERFDNTQCDLYEQLLNLNRTSLSGGQNSLRIALKQFVKEKVKHQLNDIEAELGTFKDDNNGDGNVSSMEINLKEFKVKNILSHAKFKEFVTSVTDELFDTFAAQCGDDNGDLVADLVIFSGRASSLSAVRKGVMDYFLSKNEDCKFLDIATQKFVSLNDLSTPGATNGLKEAVVEGAMIYATSFVDNPLNKIIDKNIYATYGLMLNLGNNDWYWQPMIDGKTTPKATVERAGRRISTYDSSMFCCEGGDKNFALDFNVINCCYIVQTYDSKNTLQNWKERRREMMTVLGKINGADLAQFRGLGSIPVVMKVSAENRIELHIGEGYITVLPHDDFDDVSFRKSMWPVIWG